MAKPHATRWDEQNSAKDAKIGEQAKRIDALQADVKRISAELGERNRQIATLLSERDQRDVAIRELKLELSGTQNVLANAEQKIKKQHYDDGVRLAEIKRLRSQVELLKGQTGDMNRQIIRLQNLLKRHAADDPSRIQEAISEGAA